jgi:hypothetical protein
LITQDKRSTSSPLAECLTIDLLRNGSSLIWEFSAEVAKVWCKALASNQPDAGTDSGSTNNPDDQSCVVRRWRSKVSGQSTGSNVGVILVLEKRRLEIFLAILPGKNYMMK